MEKFNRFTFCKLQWKFQKQWNSFSVIADSVATPIGIDSEEEFITEHYWGYTAIDKKVSAEYGVLHPRWEVYKVNEYKIDVDFDKIYGSDFAFLSSQTPDSVMLAEGSEIAVQSMNKL